MNNKDARFFGKAMALSIAIVVVYGLAVTYFIEDASRRGTFGDMFGGINALFTGLAFAGLVYTILQQKNQLEMQREELALQRKELADTRKEFEEQNKTLRLQRFENTFFQMLDQCRSIANSINSLDLVFVSPAYKPVGNRSGFGLTTLRRGLLNCMIEKDMIGQPIGQPISRVVDKDHISSGYNKFYEREGRRLDHYFKSLYHIFKLVDNCIFLNDEERIFYVSIIISQLSYDELILTFFKVLVEGINYSESEFTSLAKKYEVFDNMDKKDLEDFYSIYESL